jgi:hypothetical protein
MRARPTGSGMGEGRKNATKTVTCQIDDLRLVAGNVICLVSAGLKIFLADYIRFSTYRGSEAAQLIWFDSPNETRLVI